MGSKASVVIAFFGLILLALCVGWTQYLDRDDYWWSDEQAKEYDDAGDEFHRLSYAPRPTDSRENGSGNAADGDPLARAEARFARAQNDLENALARKRKPALILKWTGILLVVIGVVGLFASREAE